MFHQQHSTGKIRVTERIINLHDGVEAMEYRKSLVIPKHAGDYWPLLIYVDPKAGSMGAIEFLAHLEKHAAVHRLKGTGA